MTAIQRYPALSDPITPLGSGTSAPEVGSTTAISAASVERVLEISAHAAITDDPTIKANEASVRPVTFPPNHRTSPYAIRMIVRFLKILQIISADGQLIADRRIRVYRDREELLFGQSRDTHMNSDGLTSDLDPV